jgi:type I restriction enzyme S subunit
VKLPAYPEYKPSGVEWFGDVPEHWEVKRLKTSAISWVSNVDKVPAEDELPVRLCNYTDVYYHDHITPEMELMETTATADEIRRFGLRVGDVIITKDSEDWSDIAVPALVKKTAPDLVCGYHLAIIRSNHKALFGDYLLRAFQSCAVNQQFQVAASGVTRYGLPKASIGEAWIPLPAPAEQRAIAAFLDRETGRVDRLVAKKLELIERLKEKRIALISRTVTRGLPAEAAAKAGIPTNPPLKHSGLDWLGDIPEHWFCTTLKRVVSVCGRIGFRGYTTDDLVDEGDGALALGGANLTAVGRLDFTKRTYLSWPKYEESPEIKVAVNDLVIGQRGTCGNVVLIDRDIGPATINPSLVLLKQPKIHGGFLCYWLMGRFIQSIFDSYLSATAVPMLSQQQIGNVPVCHPPLPEQAAIAAYLDVETAKLDALVGKVEEAVERLQEYRTALITAAVTGKIDVRPETK